MRLKKAAAVLMTTAMVFSMTACGGGDSNGSSGGTTSKKTTSESSSAGSSENTESTGTQDYTTVELGKTGTDITTTIKMLTHRTDMLKDDYNGTSYKQYLAEFNKMYPNITVDIAIRRQTGKAARACSTAVRSERWYSVPGHTPGCRQQATIRKM